LESAIGSIVSHRCTAAAAAENVGSPVTVTVAVVDDDETRQAIRLVVELPVVADGKQYHVAAHREEASDHESHGEGREFSGCESDAATAGAAATVGLSLSLSGLGLKLLSSHDAMIPNDDGSVLVFLLVFLLPDR